MKGIAPYIPACYKLFIVVLDRVIVHVSIFLRGEVKLSSMSSTFMLEWEGSEIWGGGRFLENKGELQLGPDEFPTSKNLVRGVQREAGSNEKKVAKVLSASNRVFRSYSAQLMILLFGIV